MSDYPKDINLSVLNDFCLYSNGNYVAKFDSIQEILDYVKKDAQFKFDPYYYLRHKNYTLYLKL